MDKVKAAFRKFFGGKKWTKSTIKKLEKQNHKPLVINKIK